MKYLQENRTVSLIDAAANGDLYEIKRLQAMGVDLNQADYDGRTALHLASAGNQLDTNVPEGSTAPNISPPLPGSNHSGTLGLAFTVSTQCFASTPVKCLIWCLQLKPQATIV